MENNFKKIKNQYNHLLFENLKLADSTSEASNKTLSYILKMETMCKFHFLPDTECRFGDNCLFGHNNFQPQVQYPQ